MEIRLEVDKNKKPCKSFDLQGFHLYSRWESNPHSEELDFEFRVF